MKPRLDYFSASFEAMNTLLNTENYVASCHKDGKLDYKLIELVKMRVSQINGCANCLDMHSKDTIAKGETPQRLYTLSAWKEAPFYSEQERAALAWAEANTLLAENKISDELFNQTKAHFSDSQLVDLTLVITSINTWNRFSISFGSEVGSYEVA